jgi:hypothetical protein
MFKQTVKRLVYAPGRAYVRRLTEEDARTAVFRPDNERTVEYSFALRQLALAYPRPEHVLDVGTGRTAWPHLLYSAGLGVTAIDNVSDYWPAGMINRHWPVANVDITRPDGFSQTFDAITCLSVLEHIPNHVEAMRQMTARLNPAGLLIVSTPFAANEPHCEDVCRRPDSNRAPTHSYVCQSFSAGDLQAWQKLGLELVGSEYWRMFTGPVFRTGDLTRWQLVTADERHQLGCFAFRRAV